MPPRSALKLKLNLKLELTLLLLLTPYFPSPLLSQETAPRQENADQRRRPRPLRVHPGPLRPHWDAAGSTFWFRHTTAENRHSFIRVDAEQGTQTPAFDHPRLAAALTTHAGHPVDPDQLPISDLHFHDDGAFSFRFEKSPLRYDPATDTLQPQKPDARPRTSSPSAATSPRQPSHRRRNPHPLHQPDRHPRRALLARPKRRSPKLRHLAPRCPRASNTPSTATSGPSQPKREPNSAASRPPTTPPASKSTAPPPMNSPITPNPPPRAHAAASPPTAASRPPSATTTSTSRTSTPARKPPSPTMDRPTTPTAAPSPGPPTPATWPSLQVRQTPERTIHLIESAPAGPAPAEAAPPPLPQARRPHPAPTAHALRHRRPASASRSTTPLFPNPWSIDHGSAGRPIPAASPSSTTSAATRSCASSPSTPRPAPPAPSSTSSPDLHRLRQQALPPPPRRERTRSSGCPSATAGTTSTSSTPRPAR